MTIADDLFHFQIAVKRRQRDRCGETGDIVGDFADQPFAFAGRDAGRDRHSFLRVVDA